MSSRRLVSMQCDAEPTCFYLHLHAAVALLPSTVTTASGWGLIFEPAWPDWMWVKSNLQHPPVCLFWRAVYLCWMCLSRCQFQKQSAMWPHITGRSRWRFFPPRPASTRHARTEARQQTRGWNNTNIWNYDSVGGGVSIAGRVRPYFSSGDMTGTVLQTGEATYSSKSLSRALRSPKNENSVVLEWRWWKGGCSSSLSYNICGASQQNIVLLSNWRSQGLKNTVWNSSSSVIEVSGSPVIPN